MSSTNWVVVSWLLVLAPLCSGLYFHIGETERKCFIEELPEETMVIVNYKVELYDPRSQGFMPSTPGIGMHVEVRDPDDKPVLSRVYSSEGRISFTSHVAGEHVICLYSNSSSWFSGAQLRVHLDIQVGEHAIDYAQVAQKEKLSELQLRVRQLLDQVEQITKEQNYQRYREERFRQTSESTNQRVLWWSIGQTAILLAMGAWQMRHLKSFFEAKKLVLRGLFTGYLDQGVSAFDMSVQSLTEPAKRGDGDPLANNKDVELTDDLNRELLVEVEHFRQTCIMKFIGCVPCSTAAGRITRFLSRRATYEPSISYIKL